MMISTPFKSFTTVISDTEVVQSIWRSIWISMVTTLLFAIFAIPLAYVLARYDFPLKRLINGLVDLPVVIPHSVVGIALLGFFTGNSIVGKGFDALGLRFLGTPFAISMAMAFVSLPFLINSARDGFHEVPVKLEQAAISLGATPFQVFLTISLPLAWRSIASGLVMMFARGMSEFGAVIIVAYHPMVAPVLIYDRFTSFGLKYAQPVALTLLLICLAIFILFRSIFKKENS